MPVRITRVYTRSGDQGETSLVGGGRVPKDSQRIVAYGTVDELNASLGLVRAFAAERSEPYVDSDLIPLLKRLQNELFDLGSQLATPPAAEYEQMWKVSENEIRELEAEMDRRQEELAPLKSFVLPGGGTLGALLHQARTICRRSEVEVLRLSRQESVSPLLIGYLNRLSDLLFVLSRWVAKRSGEPEYLWERGLRFSERKR